MKMFITGLYNRGKADEYVELEAAARCSLEGLMLVRFVYNEEGYPIYKHARLFEFPDTNLRKGNRVRLYTGFVRTKKENGSDGITYNFSWNLDSPIWDGANVEAHIIETGDRQGIAPTEPIEDLESPEERGAIEPLTKETFSDALERAIIEGRTNVKVEETCGFVPLTITGKRNIKN